MDGDFITPLLSEFNTKLRDLEEKQRLLKERVLLIGQNLIETKEAIEKEVGELKLFAEEARKDISNIKESIISLSEELEKKARKQEVEIIAKQIRMFSPLELVRMQDLKKIIGK